MMKDSPSKKPAWDFHPTVFLTSAIIIILAVVIGLIYIGQNSAEQAEQLFSSLKTAMSNATGWFFILSVNIFLILVLYIGFSKYGNIRIGGKEAQPEFSRLSWFAMLFSSGMGIGLVFWSVAEPISMQTCMASLLLVCLVERVVRVPSGSVKQKKRYFVSFFEIRDAMGIN